MDLLFALDDYILFGIWLVAIPVGGYAFVHALMQRADAFTAADKLTKPAWLGITGASLLVLILFRGPQEQRRPVLARRPDRRARLHRRRQTRRGRGAGRRPTLVTPDDWAVLGTLRAEAALSRPDLLR